MVEALEPFALYDTGPAEARARELASAYGLGYVIRQEPGPDRAVGGSTSAAAAAAGIPAIIAEAGGCGLVERAAVDAHVRGLDRILAALGCEFILTPDDPRQRGSAPAEAFLVDGGPARVGVIASVTRPFCGTCDRVRLTADGQVRNCLFARSESDLRGPLRAGADDAELAAAWRRAVAVKLPGHGINDPSFLQPDRPMSAIGG